MMERFEDYIGVTPSPNQPPIASFTYYPENPIVNQEITFDASDSYDPDGNITNTTEKIIKYSYSEAGSYEVTLTVTDNEGATNSTTKEITVYPPTKKQLLPQSFTLTPVKEQAGTPNLSNYTKTAN